ncbi:MAG: ABC transporter permease subunit [Acidobacteria bacterium]|nr:ABC transporter permease subunit [Acidobacteriota bacterium]
MRTLVANVEEVFREAAARWVLVAYFAISTIFILVFSFAINLDIVDGALAGAKIFGQAVESRDLRNGGIDIEQLVLGFESGFSVFLYIVGTFLALFATAHLVPRLQEKGTIDLYLSRPVGRVQLLLSRYLGGLLLSASNLFYLMGSIWLVVVWKTKVVHPQFFLAALVILLVIASFLSFSFLVGTLTGSTGVATMTTFSLFFLSLFVAAHDRMAAALDSELAAGLLHGLYWILPKTQEMGKAVFALVAGEEAPGRLASALTLSPFLTTAAFGVVCLALASWHFQRKDF